MSTLTQTLFWWLTLIWSTLVLASNIWYQRNLDHQVILIATEHAKDNWQKDAAFRRWATRHGGLYVNVDDRTPPSEGLAHLSHRDVTTTSGAELTLMNPAYMMRQMTEEFEEMYGVKGKITGKVLLNPPVNMPDEWEFKVLSLFEQGQLDPVTEVTNIGTEAYLRYMKPMLMTSQGCVTCHGHLGFKLGDVRGGVSVSIPLAGYQAAMKETKRSALFSHVVIWLCGMGGVWLFITRKTQQEALQRDMERSIQRSLRMGSIGQMAGGIAHDFNNLLNIVVGNADLLKLQIDQPELRSKLDSVIAAANRGSKLTHQLLEFARGETGEQTAFCPSTSIDKLLDMLRATIPANIKITRHTSAENLCIQANKHRFEDSITNLILNAIDALEYTDNPTIEVTLETVNLAQLVPQDSSDPMVAELLKFNCSHYCHIRIKDNGCGMTDDTTEHIFEPFFTTKVQGKGTGLGLSQAYAFVQSHHGAIRANSELGKGTSFDLYLPLTDGHIINRTQTESVTLPTQILKIVILDDEPEVGDIIRQYLGYQGHHCNVFQHAADALDYLKTNHADLLITDIMMPDINGYQLVTQVRAVKANLPVIYMSGYEVEDIAKRFPQAQHNSVKLQKPIRQSRLVSALGEITKGVDV